MLALRRPVGAEHRPLSPAEDGAPPRADAGGAGAPSREPGTRRRRRWIAYGLVGAALVTAVRLTAPVVVAGRLERGLGEAFGGAVEIYDVDLSLRSAELTAKGIFVAPAAGSSSTVSIGQLRVRRGWGAILRRAPGLDVAVSDVAVTLDLRAPWPAAHVPGPRTGLGPLTLRLDGGQLALGLAPDEPPLQVLRDVTGKVADEGAAATDGSMTTQFEVRARVGEDGRLALSGSFSPVEPQESWTMRIELDGLDLRPFNPLFRRLLELDVQRGRLSVTGDLSVTRGRLRGRLVPRFEQIRLLGRGETDVRHPMAEALFGEMLASADLPIEIDRPAHLGGLDLDAALAADAVAVLERVVLQGFIRRLNTLEGHDATVGELEIDFPAGLLSFRDITLTRTGGAIAEPFLHVERMDVVVEPTATDPALPTYKAVTLHAPRLLFVAGETAAESQLAVDPDWQDKLSVLPYPTERLTVVDGRVEYRDDRARPPARIVADGLHLIADDLARESRARERRGATLSATARVMGDSALKLEMTWSPAAAPPDAEIRLSLEPLPLARLNALARARAGVDFSRGRFGFAAELDARSGRLRGSIVPEFDDVVVLGTREREVDRPLREWLLERRLKKLDGRAIALDLELGDDLPRALRAALLSAVRAAR